MNTATQFFEPYVFQENHSVSTHRPTHRCISFKLLKNYRSVKQVISASRSILKPCHMSSVLGSEASVASTEDFFKDEDSLDSSDGKLMRGGFMLFR